MCCYNVTNSTPDQVFFSCFKNSKEVIHMALGGGNFTSQNKILPGTYINTVSTPNSGVMSERGVVAVPLEQDWGPSGEVIKVTASNFYGNAKNLFGYDYTHSEMKQLRDLFKHASVAYCYRLGTGGLKASNLFCTAKYEGIRGNDLTTVITADAADETILTVETLLENDVVDVQVVTGTTTADLVSNDWVDFLPGAALSPTAGTALTGGTNAVVATDAYQDFLDRIEPYAFNVLTCPSTDVAIKGLFVEFTRRLRDVVGSKFQTVVHGHKTADYEGVISVKNNTTSEIVFWVSGISAECPIGKSLTNRLYDGEAAVDTIYKQSDLEQAILDGEFVLHNVNGDTKVLKDINTLVTYTVDKNEIFASNQTIRIIDQIATDTAIIFNTNYLGIIPNDESGRISLWNDLVKHRQNLQTGRAIENFNPDDVVVTQGENKQSVVVNELVTIVNAMDQLYVTTVVQ